MKKLAVCLFEAALLTACADDPGGIAAPDKTEVDRAALEEGFSVTLTSGLGSVTVPFTEPAAAATAEAMRTAIVDSVSLVVRNDTSGATTNLMSGAFVQATPAEVGQYAVALNEDRRAMVVTFFNETSASQSLRAGSGYTATLSVSTNDYVENLGTTAVAIYVK
ncbi:MAG: hypothetical protein V3V08_09365 [Nannocystaceae bacterium]